MACMRPTAASSCFKTVTMRNVQCRSFFQPSRCLAITPSTRQSETLPRSQTSPSLRLNRAESTFGTRTISHSATAQQKSPAQAASSAEHAQVPQLTWNDFLVMRRRRRFVNLAASVGTAVGSAAVTVPLALQYEVDDQIASITGFDPFLALGLTITAVGGLGWLMGPFVGNAGFLLWNRRVKDQMAKKEKDFYRHIKRFRADPTSSSVNNPVPDYYGEKIGSVADYRRWLKDQKAFNRKKNKNLI